MATFKVLIIVLDERQKGVMLARRLERSGLAISVCTLSSRVASKIQKEKVDLVIADTAWINSTQGLSVIESINALGISRPSVVMVSGLCQWWDSSKDDEQFDSLVNWRELTNVLEYFSNQKLKRAEKIKKAA